METIKAIEVGMEGYQMIQTGKDVNMDEMNEKIMPMLHEMALDVSRQRKRLGGKFAIAQAVFSRAQRDQIKRDLGSDLIFVVMNLTKECQHKRVTGRHGDDAHGQQFAGKKC